MPKKEITKKVISISIDIGLEKKLREIAKSERQSISYIAEKYLLHAILSIENNASNDNESDKKEKWAQFQSELNIFRQAIETILSDLDMHKTEIQQTKAEIAACRTKIDPPPFKQSRNLNW